MLDHMNMFAGYNQWANGKLYDAAGLLSDEDFYRDCAVAFSSMHGTLNHILGGDMIWMSRLQNKPAPALSLDTILHETLAGLRIARQGVDRDIVHYVAGLDETQLSAQINYTPLTAPEPVTQTRLSALSHLFNHQTHHRGQAHAILTRLTGEAPALDLLYYQREMRIAQVH